MLMITSIEEGDSTRILRPEGKLQGPWVQVLRAACDDEAEPTRRLLCLDLAEVRFADNQGVECLHKLIRGGMPVVACSGFLGSLLEIEG